MSKTTDELRGRIDNLSWDKDRAVAGILVQILDHIDRIECLRGDVNTLFAHGYVVVSRGTTGENTTVITDLEALLQLIAEELGRWKVGEGPKVSLDGTEDDVPW